MSRPRALLIWLEEKSDWLSPLVVKEVRQLVRGREFAISLVGALVAGLVVAFFGAADALSGTSSAGSWTFAALSGCLGFLGLAVVPLGALNALRNERMEQTLELITLTSLSPRRIVVGKLLAQSVKLATLFAAVAPFITMSFLLGGVDLATILLALIALFLVSVWAGALCLFLSTTFTSRAMSGLVFAVVAVMAIFVLVISRSVFMAMSMGVLVPGASSASLTSSSTWWTIAIMTSFWLATLVNLILLAENRLSLPTEDSITPLRLGFLAQFLLIVAWTTAYLLDRTPGVVRYGEMLAVFGSMHLAVVAIFVVTEGFSVPRRVVSRMRSGSRWGWALATFGPGAGRGATYLLVQMALLAGGFALFQPGADEQRKLLAACGYICFFTAVPALAISRLLPRHATPLKLRVAVLLAVAAVVVLPDIIHYAIMRPETLDLSYTGRHLLNPFRTIANWDTVEAEGWTVIPFAVGVTGVLACLALVRMGARATEEPEPVDPHRPAPVAGEAGSADLAN